MRVLDLLKDKLSEEELRLLPRSYDLIGDILIIELKEELESKEKLIGEAFLQFHKNAKVILKKTGTIKGIRRIGEYQAIAGEHRTQTLHLENNCKFKLDLSKVFFTPRLASERLRVARQVREGEVVVDLFSGVGPFSVLIAKFSKAKKVYAIDINQDAIAYLKENILLNKVWGKVIPIQGDCREVVKRMRLKGDRVIMNLPQFAGDFLDVGLKAAKREAIVHFYYFLPESELFEGAINLVRRKSKEAKKKIEILECIRCGQVGPRYWRICVDFKVI